MPSRNLRDGRRVWHDADMGISKSLLSDGEYVVLSVRAHRKAIIWPGVVLVVVVGCLIGVLMLKPNSAVAAAAAVVSVPVLITWSLIPFLAWMSSTYTVTNRRLITRHGVLTRTGRDIPLFRINDVAYEMGLMDRLLGCGTLIISDASENAGVVLPDIPHVEQVQLQISDLLFTNDDGNDQDGRRVREFGRGVSGAVDGLVRQNHAFHRVDEAVGGFRKQGHEEKKGAEAEKGGEVGAYPYSEQDLNPGQHRREQGVYDGNHFEADAVASQVAEHFAAAGEFAEQVDQQPVAMGVDAEAAQHAGDGGAAQVALECLQDGVHERSAWMMRETPVSRPAEPVRLRKTSSSVDSWVDALSVSAEPSAINAPLWMMRTRLQMRSTTSRTWEL